MMIVSTPVEAAVQVRALSGVVSALPTYGPLISYTVIVAMFHLS